MIEMILGRIHVMTPDREAVEYVISRLREGMKTYLEQPREMRRQFLRDVLRVHHDNRQLYIAVMTGRF